MNPHSIATIISFCSNEARFFASCIREVSYISSRIIVVVWDHLFDGSKENIPLLEKLAHQFPECEFYLFPFVPSFISNKLRSKIGKDLWFNLSLLLGTSVVDNKIEYLLYLDADEIIEKDRFMQWLDTGQYRFYDAMTLANYWYFRLPSLRAVTWEDSIVFVRKEAVRREFFFRPGIRFAIFDNIHTNKRKKVVGLDGLPMIHHYSWVRTKEEMVKKIQASAHRLEKPWNELIETEFSHAPQNKDFVHGYTLQQVVPLHSWEEFSNPDGEEEKETPANFHRISPSYFLRMLGYNAIRRLFLMRLFYKKLELNRYATKS